MEKAAASPRTPTPRPPKAARRNSTFLLQAADQVGGGLCGFFDFVDAVSGEPGTGEVVGENVGVGVNHTKQIIDGVGNDFGARGRMGGVFAEIEAEIQVLWNQGSFSVGNEGADGRVKGV
jgi:hypothetical protein